MDANLLNSIFPSLLIISAIAFSLLISLPRLKFWLRREFDRKLAQGKMRASEFFAFTYYIAITEYLDYIAIIYLISLLLGMISPLANDLKFASYYIVLFATSALVLYILITIPISLRKALANAKIT